MHSSSGPHHPLWPPETHWLIVDFFILFLGLINIREGWGSRNDGHSPSFLPFFWRTRALNALFLRGASSMEAMHGPQVDCYVFFAAAPSNFMQRQLVMARQFSRSVWLLCKKLGRHPLQYDDDEAREACCALLPII